MRRYLISQLAHRRGRTTTLAVGILVAAVSFTLLTSVARTGQLSVRRAVAENFRPAYDILVRPPGSFTSLEKNHGLVRENYLSGIYGGISNAQWQTIQSIPGVEVAAPIANVGYIMPFTFIPITINSYLNDDDFQLYRLRYTWIANGGLSRYPDSTRYIYYTRRDPLRIGTNNLLEEVLPDGDRVRPCRGFATATGSRFYTSPFDLRALEGMSCFSERSPRLRYSFSDFGAFPRGQVGTTGTAFFPILIAAVDPVEEQKLVDLDETIIEGRPLRASESARPVSLFRYPAQIIPVLASTRTYVDEELRIDIERLRIPPSVDLPRRLAKTRNTDRWIRALPGQTVGSETSALAPLYDRLLERYTDSPLEWKDNRISYAGYWTASDVTYQRGNRGRLRPAVTRNDPALTFPSYYGSGWAPQENADTNFRKLDDHQMIASGVGVPIHVVGRFDPELLPGFSRLSEVPLETYYAPELDPADARSRVALQGRPLRPTQSIADYIAQPPMMLTTIDAMEVFRDPGEFAGTYDNKPISVVRVRVAGVEGADEISRERIKNVAAAIHDRTGLSVDITAGSSPRQVLIELPEGKFGRPELLLREGWVEKGVAVRFLDAVDRKSLVLFGLILLICGFFIANAALASVRTRRSEIGTLMCLGWSRSKVFAAVVAEVGTVGLIAGAVGALIAAGVETAFDLDMPPMRTLLVVPVAVLLAIAAGLPPAWKASRGTPLDAVTPAIFASSRPRAVRHIATLALTNLARIPARTFVACLGLVLGVGTLTVLLALNNALQGVLVGTLLGNYISIQVRAVDIFAVLLVIALSAASIADVLFVNLKERAAEFATLSTGGWTDRHLATLALIEGITMGLFGSLLGGTLGLAVAASIRGVAVAPSAAVAFAVAVGAALVTVAACVVPVAGLTRVAPATVLADE